MFGQQLYGPFRAYGESRKNNYLCLLYFLQYLLNRFVILRYRFHQLYLWYLFKQKLPVNQNCLLIKKRKKIYFLNLCDYYVCKYLHLLCFLHYYLIGNLKTKYLYFLRVVLQKSEFCSFRRDKKTNKKKLSTWMNLRMIKLISNG